MSDAEGDRLARLIRRCRIDDRLARDVDVDPDDVDVVDVEEER